MVVIVVITLMVVIRLVPPAGVVVVVITMAVVVAIIRVVAIMMGVVGRVPPAPRPGRSSDKFRGMDVTMGRSCCAAGGCRRWSCWASGGRARDSLRSARDPLWDGSCWAAGGCKMWSCWVFGGR